MKRLIVALSGATGQIYGIRTLEILNSLRDVETHLIVTKAAEMTIEQETNYTIEEVKELADFVYDIDDVGARIASGSFKTEGMLIIPSSIKTASAISNSYNSNLLIRAADVVLKEKRVLVIVVRETPLHLGHLRMLTRLAELGAVIMPPVPAFYNKPKIINDIVNHTVGRALDFFEIDHKLYNPWDGTKREEKLKPIAEIEPFEQKNE